MPNFMIDKFQKFPQRFNWIIRNFTFNYFLLRTIMEMFWKCFYCLPFLMTNVIVSIYGVIEHFSFPMEAVPIFERKGKP